MHRTFLEVQILNSRHENNDFHMVLFLYVVTGMGESKRFLIIVKFESRRYDSSHLSGIPRTENRTIDPKMECIVAMLKTDNARHSHFVIVISLHYICEAYDRVLSNNRKSHFPPPSGRFRTFHK